MSLLQLIKLGKMSVCEKKSLSEVFIDSEKPSLQCCFPCGLDVETENYTNRFIHILAT